MTMQAGRNEAVIRGHRPVFRLVLCALILTIGVIGFFALAAMKEPPAEVSGGERALKVAVRRVKTESIPIAITGYGTVTPLKSVQIASEVAGRVIAVHSRLETGEVIEGGELLLRIDPREYGAILAQSDAEVARWRSVIQRLKRQAAIDERRLATLERSRDLARAEFDRARDLLRQHRVGTQSGVDRAEQAYNAAVDQADQMAQAVALYPSRIREASSSLAGAVARRNQARINLDRCEILSPFTGRLTAAAVEQGQYVTPGAPLLTMADDSLLELLVPLDSRDVRKWLRFKTSGSPGSWFDTPEPVTCRIRWTEDKTGHAWNGVLHRVVVFDQETRTVTVAIRVSARQAAPAGGGLPLVEGMFCAVEIPGKTLHHAVQVPRTAVSFKNTVFVAADQRLKTVPVDVARIDGDVAYITAGLSEGDQVIVTRLVDPLENTLLEILPERR